jgi:GNAT superfamily N-acetyltransferase
VIELKNFGLVPEAQGRGIGPRLLGTSLQREWESGAKRIWLHTDTWDHPAAVPVYERAGFRVYDVRYEVPESL